MVFDSIKNLKKYINLVSGLDSVVNFLNNTDIHNLKSGDISIKGEDIFVKVIEYETTSEGPLKGKFETHRRYIDIQCMAKGCEVIRYSNVSELKGSVKYDPQKDFELFDSEDYSSIILNESQFVLFFPHDGHEPGCLFRRPEKVKKLVFKVRL